MDRGPVLNDRLGAAEDREHEPAERVDGGGRTEHRRPALRQLEDVAGQVDAEKARDRPDRVHQAEHTARVVRSEVLRVDGHRVVVESRQAYGLKFRLVVGLI